MTSHTKAELGAAVTRLREENEALRDLLAAVRDCMNTPAAPRGEFSKEDELDRKRASQVRTWLANVDFGDAETVAFITSLFRDHTEPVTYRPVCDEMIREPGEPLRYCQLDPGHDGCHSPEAHGGLTCECGHGYDSHGRALDTGQRLHCNAYLSGVLCDCRRYEVSAS